MKCGAAAPMAGTMDIITCSASESGRNPASGAQRETAMHSTSSGLGDVLAWSTIEMAPDLPLSVFTSVERWHEERIGALALYCSDGRWGEAFDEFCHRHLHIPRYDRLALPGGPAWLAAADGHGDDHQQLGEQLDFLVHVHELERIILITHFGCAHYGHRLQRSPRECLPAQTEDVRTAAISLRRWYPEMRVEAYLAMRTGRVLSFHELGH
jgi:hypothetical protein